MANPNLFMFLAVFVASVWWTQKWLMNPLVARWRFVLATLASIIGWVYSAYRATRVTAGSGGVEIIYGDFALAWFCAFMALVSTAGLLLGLLLWVEEEAEHASKEFSAAVRGGDD